MADPKDIYPDSRLVPCASNPISGWYLENTFRSFHQGIYQMSTENQKPVAPGTAKVEPASTPAPQQNQGDAKPGTDKPAGQQK
jgi:hypothetical protein